MCFCRVHVARGMLFSVGWGSNSVVLKPLSWSTTHLEGVGESITITFYLYSGVEGGPSLPSSQPPSLFQTFAFHQVWLTTKCVVPTLCSCGACWECMENNELTQDDEDFLYIINAHNAR